MHDRVLRRAAVAAVALAIAVVGIVAADTLSADGDEVQPGIQGDVHLGTFGPGETVTVDVSFTLACSGFRHVDAGQSIVLTQGAAQIPDGTTASVTDVTLSPPPTGWPEDGADCTAAPEPVTPPQVSTVTLSTPAGDGEDYEYLITWNRALSPTGSLDSNTFTGMTAITFRLDVVSNTPPVLSLPADMTVEGNTLGGWSGGWTASATDAEDDPDPTPICSPVAGALFPLGTTTVSCSVEDSGGLGDSGSFDVTVVDTTAPTLTGVPADQSVTTSDPAGVTVSWTDPTATDVIDGDVGITCLPASGSTFAVGETVVTCSASDASDNEAQSSFTVAVEYVPATVVSVTWAAPIGTSAVVAGNNGRTLPLKASVLVDGAPLGAAGPAPRLLLDRLDACGGTVVERREGPSLTWSGDGWRHNLDSASLDSGCWRVSLHIAGVEAGAFDLDLRSTGPTAQKKTRTDPAASAAPAVAPEPSVSPSEAPPGELEEPAADTGG